MSSGNFKCWLPSNVLAVGVPFGEATVKDANQAIGEGSQSLVVSLTTRTQRVVSTTGAIRRGESREGPPVARVGESPVSCHPCEDDLAGARSLGDGRHAGVVLAGFRMCESSPVVAELG